MNGVHCQTSVTISEKYTVFELISHTSVTGRPSSHPSNWLIGPYWVSQSMRHP